MFDKRFKKDIKKRKRKMKNEKLKKNETTAINFFIFTFCIWRTL